MTMDARALIVCAAMAVAAGLVGCFAVMRRMTLAADAFSHVALPGIGLALVLRLNPLLGALAALLAGAVLIWAIEGKTKLSTEMCIRDRDCSSAIVMRRQRSRGQTRQKKNKQPRMNLRMNLIE